MIFMENNFPFDEIMNDLDLAIRLRDEGEFGKSRVCARKAAGKAVRFKLIQSFSVIPDALDPYSAIRLYQKTLREDDPLIPHLKILQMRVDKDFNLPDEIDILFSAKFVITQIINEGS
jgi:hypothetical protein